MWCVPGLAGNPLLLAMIANTWYPSTFEAEGQTTFANLRYIARLSEKEREGGREGG